MTAISSVEKEQLRQLQISIHGNFAAVHIKQAKVSRSLFVILNNLQNSGTNYQ